MIGQLVECEFQERLQQARCGPRHPRSDPAVMNKLEEMGVAKNAKLGQTAVDFPPMQPSASFNLEAVKQQVEKAISSRTGQ